MIVGMLFAGVAAGLGAFALSLAGGQTFWFGLLAYAGTGSTTVMLLAILVAVAQGAGRSRRAPLMAAARRG